MMERKRIFEEGDDDNTQSQIDQPNRATPDDHSLDCTVGNLTAAILADAADKVWEEHSDSESLDGDVVDED